MRARITLLDGTVIDDAAELAVRPAALYFTKPGRLYGRNQDVVAVDQVRQIEILEDDHTVRGPQDGDIGTLDWRV